MAEEFEDRDLSGAVFWGVNLTGARFRDADLTGSQFFHTFWREVEIDGEIDRLVVNGVDVTAYVNRNDRWYPLRYRLSPLDAAGIRSAWAELGREWSALLDSVDAADPLVATTPVDGEWTLVETIRHLVFAMDKWVMVPLLGDTSFTSIGLPNTGSQGLDWPGLDRTADPGLFEALAVRRAQHERFEARVDALDTEALPTTVDVPENGEMPTMMCFHAVLEEEFEHLRYMHRDLGRLGIL
jgi:hypothetical protein